MSPYTRCRKDNRHYAGRTDDAGDVLCHAGLLCYQCNHNSLLFKGGYYIFIPLDFFGLVRFLALVLRLLMLLFLLGGRLLLPLFQRLFALLGGFVGLALRIDRYLRPALGGGGNVFRLHLVGGFALCAGLHMTVELNALPVL